jgi:magnesium transporter
VALALSIRENKLRDILDELYFDDKIDFLEEMPANFVKSLLQNTPAEERAMINQFLRYPENSAGSLMTIEYVDLKRYMTVGQALARIRTIGPDTETIYYCYVLDSTRRMQGICSLRHLVLSDESVSLEELMDDDIVFCNVNDDQEEVAEKFKKYDLMALPVVDGEHRLVGIITIDDIVDVIEQENTEDFEIMGAMRPSEMPYLLTSVFKLYKNRIGWLLFLMIAGMGTGFILQGFEDAFLAVPMLVTFIPMMMDTGGNTGAQSSTMTIRGLALGEVDSTDFFKIVWKEVRVSLLIGVTLAVVALLRVFLLNMGEPDLLLKGSVISLTLIFTVFVGKLCGCTLPMIAKKLKVDPAVMAAPMITTIVDATSLLVFFSIARWLLEI